jgi:Cu-Zn family superoxide dismutase
VHKIYGGDFLNINPYRNNYIKALCSMCPAATARVKGSRSHPFLRGRVNFVPVSDGVLVVSIIKGLPTGGGKCGSGVFGFHIHEGMTCTGTESDPFADTMGHYNPDDCPHPQHAGDMPPLFENSGTAFSVLLTNRFKISEIIGRTVVIHSQPDDFTTQPSGNSGTKIACGEIERVI